MASSKRRQGGLLISRIHQLQGRVFARMLKDHRIQNINPAQGRILFVLWQEDGIPVSALSKKTSLELSTLTRMLDRLEKSGHVKRLFDPADRRRVNIVLTEKNRRLRAGYDAVSDAMSRVFYAGFSEAESAQLEQLLSRVLENLSSHQTLQ